MAKENRHNPKKLINELNVKPRGRQHTPVNVQQYKQPQKQVHTTTGMEHAPRDVSKKVDNQANKVQTGNTKRVTESSGSNKTAATPKIATTSTSKTASTTTSSSKPSTTSTSSSKSSTTAPKSTQVSNRKPVATSTSGSSKPTGTTTNSSKTTTAATSSSKPRTITNSSKSTTTTSNKIATTPLSSRKPVTTSVSGTASKGQSTVISVGAKQYTPQNLQNQKKEVHVSTGMEHAPRDVSKKLENQANKVQTANTKSVTTSTTKKSAATTTTKPTATTTANNKKATSTTTSVSAAGTTVISRKPVMAVNNYGTGSKSTIINIGTKKYTLQNLQQQRKEVHVKNGLENAPRDINKKVVNQANKIQTAGVKSVVEGKATTGKTTIIAKVTTTSVTGATSGNKKSGAATGAYSGGSQGTKVSAEKVQTNKDKQAQAMHSVKSQSNAGKKPDNVIKNPGLQVGYKAPTQNKQKKPFNSMYIQRAVHTAESQLDAQDDMADGTLSMTLKAGEKAVAAFKAAQTSTDVLVKTGKATGVAAVKTGKAAYQVGKTTVKVVRAVDQTYGMIKAGHIILNKDTIAGMKNYTVAKLKTTRPVQKIKTAVQPAVKVGKAAYKVGKTTIKVVRTVDRTYGMIKAGHIVLNKDTVARIKNYTLAKIKTSKPIQMIKTSQNPVVKVGKAVYKVGKTTVKVVRTVDRAYGMWKVGHLVLNKDTVAMLKKYAIAQVKTTRPARAVIHAVSRIKTGYLTTKRYMINVGRGIQRAAILTRGYMLGTVTTARIAKEALRALKRGAIQGAKVGAIVGRATGYTVKTAVRVGVRTAPMLGRTARMAGKPLNRLNNGLLSVSDKFSQVDDMGFQAIGLGMKTAHYTIKTGIGAYKGVKTGVKVAVKTGRYTVRTVRGIKTGIKVIRKVGGKQALKMYSKRWGKKGAKALRNAGKNALKAVVEGLKKLGMKVLVPILVIIILLFVVTGAISSAAGAIASIFSPFLPDDSGGPEIDETAWLTTKITEARNELIDEIKDTYNDNLAPTGSYHIIRFFNVFNSADIELNDTNIQNSIYSVNEYLEYIQPVFHTLMLSEYEFEATESQMETTFEEIWDKLSVIKTEPRPTEYCNAGATEPDGLIHANMTIDPICPHHSDEKHHPDNISNPLNSCDAYYYICRGHKGSCKHHCNNDCAGGCTHSHGPACLFGLNCTHTCGSSCNKYCGHSHDEWEGPSDDWCYSTSKPHEGLQMNHSCNQYSEKHLKCSGYYECLGHEVLNLSVELGDFSDLLNDYFLNRINELRGKASLTTDEQQELNELEDYYAICMNYLTVLQDHLGLGSTEVVDIGDVTLTDVTSYACTFIGKPYVWGGTDPNVGADCSGFVQYVYAHFGVSLPRVSREQVHCGASVSDIASAQPGDLIFYSDDGTASGVYHVTMYLGNGKMVHASNSKPYPAGGIKVSNVYGTPYAIKRIAH